MSDEDLFEWLWGSGYEDRVEVSNWKEMMRIINNKNRSDN